jgi:hypothetical protein
MGHISELCWGRGESTRATLCNELKIAFSVFICQIETWECSGMFKWRLVDVMLPDSP